MLDIHFIRTNLDKIKNGARIKGIAIDLDRIISLDDEKRELLHMVETLRAERNQNAKSLPKLSNREKEEAIRRGKELKEVLSIRETELLTLETELGELLLLVPNPPLDGIPEGKDERDNIEIRKWGTIPHFDFTPKSHDELGTFLDIIDIPRAAKFAGSRSYILKNEGALLENAITRFALDTVISKGFAPFSIPVLVRDEAMIGTGFFPLGKEDTYIIEKDGLNLIGTSEVSLVSYYRNEILEKKDLPKKLVSLSTCFRREAGTYGKDTKGVYRVHQFQKVEQVIMCENDMALSEKMHELLLANSEEILQKLEIPYRVALACGAETGLGQVKKHEIESWMPSRNVYSETHSCSTLHEFQARRSNIRYKDDAGKIHFVHTLNNTAIASPRILIPLLELNQNKDGSVNIPKVLEPYMNGITTIIKK